MQVLAEVGLRLATISLCIASAMLVSPAIADASRVGVPHKYVDRNGHVRYTDFPDHDGYVRMVKSWKGWQLPARNGNYRENRKTFKPIVLSISSRYAIAPELTEAVIHVESHYNPNAVSKAGAMGLMQLMPATAKRYGVHNRRNPRQNIEAGVRYLRDLMEMFNNDLYLVLAAYNAGENAVKRHGFKIPPYTETQNYVQRVRSQLKLSSDSQ